ncbi:restriction endonuclease [Arthrobacter sp. R3-55]
MYDFMTLSPHDFEHLMRDLLEASYGWKLKAFAAGPDGGVDLKVGSGSRKIVVQCKHYAGSTPAQLKKSLEGEKTKMITERPGRYFVATSRKLSKTQHESIAIAVTPPLTTCSIITT